MLFPEVSNLLARHRTMLTIPTRLTVPLLSGIFRGNETRNIILLPLFRSNAMTDQFCACGCGAKPSPGKPFIRGHHMRTPESRARMSREKARDKPSRDLTGHRFHKLVVIEWAEWRNYIHGRESAWRCQCDCGKEAIVPQKNLVGGKTKSCGCIIGQHKRTHGMTGTREFRVWEAMLRRCRDRGNSNYPRYGGRGIRVCERWLKFENFFADMGPRPKGTTLDRINNDGHYKPENCRWATAREQSNNRRSNRTLTIEGVTKTYAQWERGAGLKPGTVSVRLSQGWRGAEVLYPPSPTKGVDIHPMRKRFLNVW